MVSLLDAETITVRRPGSRQLTLIPIWDQYGVLRGSARLVLTETRSPMNRCLYRNPSSIQISEVERNTEVRKLVPLGLILNPRNDVVPFSSPKSIEAGTGPKSVISFSSA